MQKKLDYDIFKVYQRILFNTKILLELTESNTYSFLDTLLHVRYGNTGCGVFKQGVQN